jgi:hypothetical protein
VSESATLAALRRFVAAALARGEDPQALRRVVAEETAGAPAAGRGARFLGWLGGALRHPAFLLVIGAAATALVGGGLTQLWEARAARGSERAAAEAQVREFQELVEITRIRADFLRSALERGLDLREAEERRDVWDASYVDWQRRWRTQLSAIDGFLGWTGESPLAAAAAEGLASLVAETDRCLTEAWAMRGAGGESARVALDDCHADSFRRNANSAKAPDASEDHENRLRDCARETVAVLRQFVARDLHCRSTAWTQPRCADRSGECAPEDRRPGIVFAAREMVGWCWGDPARMQMTGRASGRFAVRPGEAERYCVIDDGVWARLTGVVRARSGP